MANQKKSSKKSLDTSNPSPLKQRNLLKQQLYLARAEFQVGDMEMKPRCPFCGRRVPKDNADLHEALISKGMVAGLEDRDWINVRYNCVIRHHDGPCAHTGGIGGDVAFEQAAKYLAQWEGFTNVRDWLKKVVSVYP
jgi:hypothetical protein